MNNSTSRRAEVRNSLEQKCYYCGAINEKLRVSLKTGMKNRQTIDKILEDEQRYKLNKKNLIMLCCSCITTQSLKRRGLVSYKHGRYTYYINYGCRCDLCKVANTNYMLGRKSVKQNGY